MESIPTISTADAASRLQLSRRSIRRLITDGVLKPVSEEKGGFRFSAEDIEKFRKEQEESVGTTEAAHMMTVSPGWVRKMVLTGKLKTQPVAKGQHIRIPIAEIQRYADDNGWNLKPQKVFVKREC